MSNLNKAILIGRLGKDPYHNVSQSGIEVSSFSLAVSEKGKDKQEETQWFKVTFFGKQAQVVQQYLKSGSLVYVEGRMRLDTYKDKSGQQQSMIAVIGDKLTMLGGKQDSSGNDYSNKHPAPAQRKQSYQDAAGRTTSPEDLEDDIPF